MSGTDMVLIVLILLGVAFLLWKSLKKQNKGCAGCSVCHMEPHHPFNRDDGHFSK